MTVTSAPRSARIGTVAPPMPVAPPTTSAFLPSKRNASIPMVLLPRAIAVGPGGPSSRPHASQTGRTGPVSGAGISGHTGETTEKHAVDNDRVETQLPSLV